MPLWTQPPLSFLFGWFGIAVLAYIVLVGWQLRLSKDRGSSFSFSFSGSFVAGVLGCFVSKSVVEGITVLAIFFPLMLALFAWMEQRKDIEILRRENKISDQHWWD